VRVVGQHFEGRVERTDRPEEGNQGEHAEQVLAAAPEPQRRETTASSTVRTSEIHRSV